ncbi:transposase [uncultured Tateyamaria sp.]|uniref:REP-associated tyrosine transposase n=1 Tax=uncultured Tateyamaria sp. TaxID=455651 RepID=UPI0026199E46|nr:transposase [uncultured Tateyamaria sp.]
MPNYRRPKITGASIFFTVALAQRGGTLLVDEVDALRDAVRVTRAERPFHIDACVVLPDHLHCVWTLPVGDRDFSTRWAAIKARFTRTIRDYGRVGFQPTHAKRLGHAVGWNPTLRRTESKIAKGDAGVWQRRFWEHHIRDDADYLAHVRYCWMNPVKHGLVERPEDWAYSSVHRDARFRAGMDLVL